MKTNTHTAQTSDSWCQYHRDYINLTNLYKPGPGIANDVIQEIKTVYQDLMKDNDLAKCLPGITQNANESPNSMFWERVPKNNYCGISKMELCMTLLQVSIMEGKLV